MTHIAQTNTSQADGLQKPTPVIATSSTPAPPPLAYQTGLLIR
jgi:hypothetical protein